MEERNCSLCGVRLRNKPDAVTYQISICHTCIQKDERCIELKRELNRLRKKSYYDRNTEQERERARRAYAQKTRKAIV